MLVPLYKGIGPRHEPDIPTMTCLFKGPHPLGCAPLAKRQHLFRIFSSQNDSLQPLALDNSRRLAILRSLESARPSPLLVDPFASKLAETLTSAQPPSNFEDASVAVFDLLASRFIDDQVLLAACSVNDGRAQEYNQVVLLGDGFCTRAFRLPWPTGTVIYLVAPGEVHERAEALLTGEQEARVPRGCLLRRVDCNFVEGNSCSTALKRAGYRADRLSVWALQGIRGLDLSESALSSIFADLSNLAALESVMVGELPTTTPTQADNLLASFGLLGTTFEPEVVAEFLNSQDENAWWRASLQTSSKSDKGKEPQPLLFRAQQRRLSLDEIELYESHVAAAEQVDEDFFGNFS